MRCLAGSFGTVWSSGASGLCTLWVEKGLHFYCPVRSVSAVMAVGHCLYRGGVFRRGHPCYLLKLAGKIVDG